MSKVISFRVPDAIYAELSRYGAEDGWTPHQMARGYMLATLGDNVKNAALRNASAEVRRRLDYVMRRVSPEVEKLVALELAAGLAEPLPEPDQEERAARLGRRATQLDGTEDYTETVTPRKRKGGRRGGRRR